MTKPSVLASYRTRHHHDFLAAPVLIGLAILYGPVYAQLSNSLWRTSEQAHAPLVALMVTWLFWQTRQSLAALPDAPNYQVGSSVFALGLFIALVGNSQEISFLSMLSQIPILAGLLLILRGAPALRVAWFPLLFLVFMVPLPGVLIDSLTGQLKEWVSALTVEMLYSLGYPIARSGVMITIGQYQMLVADACSGLHSIISLSALGVLFTYLMRRHSPLHNAVMIASILPMAFFANFARVLFLVMLTFHQGDEVAQQWHESAGVVVFLVALTLLISLDAMLNFLSHKGSCRIGWPQ
jgi:exosortase B